jgi:hypothetical protein
MTAAQQLWSSSHNQSFNRVFVWLPFSTEHMRPTYYQPSHYGAYGSAFDGKGYGAGIYGPAYEPGYGGGIVMVSTELAIAGISIDRRIGLVIGAASDARARVGNA